MSIYSTRNNIAYGLNNALQNLSPLPIIAQRAPTSSDIGELGQYWIYNNSIYFFTSAQTWTQVATDNASGVFSSLTVNGPTALNGQLTVTTGNLGITLNAGTGAINIGTNAASSAITIGNTTSTTAVAINASSSGIVLNANATGKIRLVPNAVSGTSLSVTNNAYVGSCVITNQTCATSATLTVTLSNSLITTSNSPIVSVSTVDTSGNHALMTITGMIQSTGALGVTLTNNGSGDLAVADSVIVSFIVVG